MTIFRSKFAARWLLALLTLGVSGLARADSYTVILKEGGSPCLTYTFTADPETTGSQTVTLSNPMSVGTPCVLADFPASVSAMVDVQPFGQTEQGGPSRITNLSGSGGGLTLMAGSSSWANTTPEPDISGAYFIYNSDGSVPAPVALTLLLLGGAGMFSARVLRRRVRK